MSHHTQRREYGFSKEVWQSPINRKILNSLHKTISVLIQRPFYDPIYVLESHETDQARLFRVLLVLDLLSYWPPQSLRIEPPGCNINLVLPFLPPFRRSFMVLSEHLVIVFFRSCQFELRLKAADSFLTEHPFKFWLHVFFSFFAIWKHVVILLRAWEWVTNSWLTSSKRS